MFVNPQIQGEIYHSSKKGTADGKGANFLSGLRNKCSKLLSEVEECESCEELIGKNLRDINTGGGMFNWYTHMEFRASHSLKKLHSPLPVIASILSGMGHEDKGTPESSLEDKIMSDLTAMEEKTASLLNIQAFKKAEASRLL